MRSGDEDRARVAQANRPIVVAMTTSADRTETHVVSNADLRALRNPRALDDPDGVAEIPARKRAALLSNPLLGPEDDPVQILGTVDGRIVGRLDLLAGSIDTPEGTIPCFWGSSLYVTPAARGHGMARRSCARHMSCARLPRRALPRGSLIRST